MTINQTEPFLAESPFARHRRRLARRLAVVVTALAVVVAPGIAADADTPTRHFTAQLGGSVAYDGFGTLDFSGPIQVTVNDVEPSPNLPPNPVRVHTNVGQAFGTGEGFTFRLVGSSSDVVSRDANSATVRATYRLFPTDPLFPNDPIRPRAVDVIYVLSFGSGDTLQSVTATAAEPIGLGD